MNRRAFLKTSAIAGVFPTSAIAQGMNVSLAQNALIFGDGGALVKALSFITDRGQPDMAASIIQAMRFSRAPQSMFSDALKSITGADVGPDWFDWMLWQEQNPQIHPIPEFQTFKRALMLQIDPNFKDFLKPQYLAPQSMGIRLEEITWGGVKKDGIPSLDNPKLLDASDASYLKDDDLIFGVSINGDTRAYPLRIMGWHEMFNEVIGGVPVALAYCTLCGSGILFESSVDGRANPFVFGSSGFLYRSNKLMFDRETNSLWNQFTGEPVVGELVGSKIVLRQRPVVITTWADWLAENPDTRVLDVDTGYSRDYASGVVYNDYFASNDLMFPTVVDQTDYKQKEFVFGVREFGAAKAWPLKAFEKETIINDNIAGKPLLLIGNSASRTVRAYERGEHVFERGSDGVLKSSDGRIWKETEEALIANLDQSLPRIAGHIAYWFAWNGYLANESEIYQLPEN